MPSSEPVLCDTTPLRYFALAERFELLVRILGGSVRTPRQVLDPIEDFAVSPSLLSEISQSEQYWSRKAQTPRGVAAWNRLRALKSCQDIEICDLQQGEELQRYAELRSDDLPQEHGLAAPLGRSKSAVMAIASTRGWGVVIDDREAHMVLAAVSPGTKVFTTRELLLHGAGPGGILTKIEAELVYADMREWGYRGAFRCGIADHPGALVVSC